MRFVPSPECVKNIGRSNTSFENAGPRRTDGIDALGEPEFPLELLDGCNSVSFNSPGPACSHPFELSTKINNIEQVNRKKELMSASLCGIRADGWYARRSVWIVFCTKESVNDHLARRVDFDRACPVANGHQSLNVLEALSPFVAPPPRPSG